jgi:hypothetical protein
MRIVIQCAGSKRDEAGSLLTEDGRPVSFVAHPPKEPDRAGKHFARPDDQSEDGRTWRQRLLAYNESAETNPLGLTRAVDLYKPEAYSRLEGGFGADKVWILSAGWGLIPAAFLTPDYDITFSSSAAPIYRRWNGDLFHDWAMIDLASAEPIVFLGGKDYLPLFARLTAEARGRRVAFFNSSREPSHGGVSFVRYETNRRTNWHYDAATALADGTLQVPV